MVFCFILLAIELFAFFPFTRHHVLQPDRHSFPLSLHLFITANLVSSACALLLFLVQDMTLLVLYLLTVLFITFACPLWLKAIHRYKLNIQGPWDVATVQSIGED